MKSITLLLVLGEITLNQIYYFTLMFLSVRPGTGQEPVPGTVYRPHHRQGGHCGGGGLRCRQIFNNSHKFHP